jgi:hypothetical protein
MISSVGLKTCYRVSYGFVDCWIPSDVSSSEPGLPERESEAATVASSSTRRSEENPKKLERIYMSGRFSGA